MWAWCICNKLVRLAAFESDLEQSMGALTG
jgi:hypothetical protein